MIKASITIKNIRKPIIMNHRTNHMYLTMNYGKIIMKCGKVWKHDLEMAVLYDENTGIFKAQQQSILVG